MRKAAPMLHSPIRWVGGKSRLRPLVIDLLPADAECYAEVFAGAAWVLFGKQPHPVEVLNDSNGDLVNLWRVLKWRPAELLEEVHHYLYSREMFEALREQRPDGADEMERAVWLYLLIQMSFGAQVIDPRSAAFGTRKTWIHQYLFLRRSPTDFEPVYERLRNVFIERLDYCDLIQRYDQPQTVFYCDPPYLDVSGYAEAFTRADHERLALTLGGIAGRFLLTINDHPAIRDMYDGYHIIEAKEQRSVGPGAERRAAADVLLITNYPPRSQTVFNFDVEPQTWPTTRQDAQDGQGREGEGV